MAIKFNQAASLIFISFLSPIIPEGGRDVPVPCLGELKLDDWQAGVVVGDRQIHALERCDAVWHDCSTDICVGVGSPAHAGGLWVAEVNTGEPARGL